MVIDKLAHNKIKVTFFPYAMKVVTIRSLVTDNTKHYERRPHFCHQKPYMTKTCMAVNDSSVRQLEISIIPEYLL